MKSFFLKFLCTYVIYICTYIDYIYIFYEVNKMKKYFDMALKGLLVMVVFSMFTFAATASPGTTTNSGDDAPSGSAVNPTASGSFDTTGGIVYATDLTADSYTERWAGFYGNVTGTISLAVDNGDEADHDLFQWTWSAADEGQVIASTSSTIEWGDIQASTADDLDYAWGFNNSVDVNGTTTVGGSDTAAAAVTSSDTTATFRIGDKNVLSAPAITSGGGWDTAIVADTNAEHPESSDFLFVTDIANDHAGFNGENHDFELIVPTDDSLGGTETYYFYVELF